ncbi:MAG: amidase family protein [Gemmatimonadota bacterium]
MTKIVYKYNISRLNRKRRRHSNFRASAYRSRCPNERRWHLSRRDAIATLGAAAGLTFPRSNLATSERADDSTGLQTACDIADAVRHCKVSAVELLDRSLARIEVTNGRLNAFVYLDPDGTAARRIDEQVRRGADADLLAGVPLGVKDLDDCAGLPTSQGSLFDKNSPATADFPSSAEARAAGAVPVSKTAAPEFGTHSITWSLAWGTTRNPWARR